MILISDYGLELLYVCRSVYFYWHTHPVPYLYAYIYMNNVYECQHLLCYIESEVLECQLIMVSFISESVGECHWCHWAKRICTWWYKILLKFKYFVYFFTFCKCMIILNWQHRKYYTYKYILAIGIFLIRKLSLFIRVVSVFSGT